MQKLPTLKDPNRELRIFQVRVWVAIGVMVILIFTVIGRLAYLQIIQYGHFTTLSRDNRLKVVPIPPTRGLIYSRDGKILAENRPSFSLEMVPERVHDVASALVDITNLLHLEDSEVERIADEWKRARGFDSVVIKTGLDERQVALFSVNRHRFPGFSIEARLSRYYPRKEQMAHVIGYVGRVNEDEQNVMDKLAYRGVTHIGKVGVEKAREDTLRGIAGYKQIEVNASGRILRVATLSPPVPGHDIYLTLDADLQELATDALGDNKGAIVAIDPGTGEVLVFVSKPSFNPNLFVDGLSKAVYSKLRESSDRPLFNRALQAQYPPGSTIKPMVALAGLEHDVRQAHDEIFCQGWLTLEGADHRYRDWLKRGHGQIDLKRSLAESCDVYYYALARDLGITRLHKSLSKFGLGRATGIDLPGETEGLLPSAEWKRRTRTLPWYPGETLITGIGQGFMLVSPLQLANATAALANRGFRFVPHVVGQIEDPMTKVATEIGIHEGPEVEVEKKSNWEPVIQGMVEVVHGSRGTARGSGVGAAFRFAGKTGTAQLLGIAQDETHNIDDLPKHLRDHAIFIAFAPVEKPEIAVAVVVENGESGSRTAAPIARSILDQYLMNATIVADDNG
ncbi:MAG TPA: penicillin-binding protein 2 [Gammaproteobacteria bacterium]|nr:penicillin-binding protein 2 [Gammaproteobacteria bacterium]